MFVFVKALVNHQLDKKSCKI